MEKPENIFLATKLLWISLGIGALSVIYDGSQQAGPFDLLSFAAVPFFTLLSLGIIVWQIGAGKNWARIAFAAIYLLNLFPFIAMLLTGQAMKIPITMMVNLIAIALQGYALYLIFTKPCGDWFSKVAKNSPGIKY